MWIDFTKNKEKAHPPIRIILINQTIIIPPPNKKRKFRTKKSGKTLWKNPPNSISPLTVTTWWRYRYVELKCVISGGRKGTREKTEPKEAKLKYCVGLTAFASIFLPWFYTQKSVKKTWRILKKKKKFTFFCAGWKHKHILLSSYRSNIFFLLFFFSFFFASTKFLFSTTCRSWLK